MSEKLDKELVQTYIDTYDSLYERVCYVVEILIKSGRMHGTHFEELVEIREKQVEVRIYHWGEYESRTFPVEYLYDDTKLDELKEEIRIAEELKKQKELEDKAYYKQLEEEDEIRLLKRLQKKYPDVK